LVLASYELEWDYQPLSQPACPIPLVHIFPIHEIALEWFDDSVCIPLGPVFVFEEVLYAGPAHRAVKLTRIALIKKFTMLLTNILFVFFAVLDFHFANPPMSAPPLNLQRGRVKISETPLER
jgi:hypothetical protein